MFNTPKGVKSRQADYKEAISVINNVKEQVETKTYRYVVDFNDVLLFLQALVKLDTKQNVDDLVALMIHTYSNRLNGLIEHLDCNKELLIKLRYANDIVFKYAISSID